MKIICDKCARSFELNATQRRLFLDLRKKAAKLVMLECPHCGSHAAIDPRIDSVSPALTPSVDPPPLRCPRAGCTGWIADISDVPAKPKKKWGCGECGTTWVSTKLLQADIDAILVRFKHREAVYQKPKSQWQGVPFTEEPRGYERAVEREAKR